MVSKKINLKGWKVPIEVLDEAAAVFVELLNEDERSHLSSSYSITKNDFEHSITDKNTFLSLYNADCEEAGVYVSTRYSLSRFSYHFLGSRSVANVALPEREMINKVLSIFEKVISKDFNEATRHKQCPIVFIGHGRSSQWRELKDHLRDQHQCEIESYESMKQVGWSNKETLLALLDKCNFAILVMTAEDETAIGTIKARDNVIHEIGLFQGRLGFERAIILLESGCEEFSNIQGVTQIRYSKGNIRETFGDVVSAINRISLA